MTAFAAAWRGFWRILPLETWLMIAAVALLVVLAAGWKCSHDQAERIKRENATLQDQVKIRDRQTEAVTHAADTRLTDAIKNHEAREELTDAIESLPDARPSDRRIALGCARLRRQGTPDADLPAVC